jgi:hypothetical protein
MESVSVATISSNKTYTQQQAPAQKAGKRSRQNQYFATIVGKTALRRSMPNVLVYKTG